MTTETQAAFARRMKDHVGRHVSRAAVKQWADKGQIVMVGNKVDVETSLAQLQATTGKRPDVAARHAEEAAKKKTAEPGVDDAQGEIVAARRLRALADSRIQQAKADMAEMEREEQAGRLVRVEDVDYALDSFGASLRSLMETFADRLAPIIWPLQTLEETHAALSEAADGVLMEMAEAMNREGRT